MKIFNDKSYRDNLTFENKDEIMRQLSKEVLEQRTLMELGRKLNILRKKCEGSKMDMQFLWALQDAFNNRLGRHIGKTEESGSIDTLMEYFPVDSIDASNVATITQLLSEYEKNFTAPAGHELVNLTDDDVKKEQELRDLKKEAVENSEVLQKNLAEIVFNEEQSKQYKKEAAAEKKLAQELSELNKVNEELEVENERLIKLQDGVQNNMKKIVEVQERRKGELTPIDMFQNIPTSVEFERKDGTFGSYKSETKEELEMQVNRRKQEKEAVIQRKEQKRKKRGTQGIVRTGASSEIGF